MTVAECPAVVVTVVLGAGGPHTLCNPFREWAFARMGTIRPDIVIAASSEVGLAKMLQIISNVFDHVFTLDPPQSAKTCRSVQR